MNKIKIYVDYNDSEKIHYYRNFTIVDELPKIANTKKYNSEVVEIKEIEKDCEQASENAYSFNCYEVKRVDYEYMIEEQSNNIDNYTYYEYVAIKKEN